VTEKDGETLRIEIKHDTIYIVATDEAANKKVIQAALKTLFRLRKKKLDRVLRVKIANIN
jgi:ribosomal protein L23